MIWNKLFGKKDADILPQKNAQQTVHSHEHPAENIIISPKIELPKVPEDFDSVSEPLFQFDDADNTHNHNVGNADNADNIVAGKSKSRLVKFLDGLKKSRNQITGALGSIFSGNAVSMQMLDDLEDVLLQADLGTQTASMLRQTVQKEKFGKDTSEQEIKDFLAIQIEILLKPVEQKLTLRRNVKPNVLLFVGVNGSGKTTTIGKFAKHFKQSGLNVMLAAGDTFRAAAVEQLTIWGERNDVPVFSRPQGSDAAGLVYDAYKHALESNSDILLIDTAGRLQNKHNLMQELLKIVRVLKKYDAALPHEIIMVLDATTGQNAMRQAEIFRDMADITGIIMTKLDGSAKGGVLVSVAHKMKLPVYAIGIGENIQDLKPFYATDFAKGLMGIE
jgi:fused signal recognition particle receptor